MSDALGGLVNLGLVIFFIIMAPKRVQRYTLFLI